MYIVTYDNTHFVSEAHN